jgi:hypothetical protein
MLHTFIANWYGETTYQVLAIVGRLYPIWLPLLAGYAFWEFWLYYIRYHSFFNTKTILLEIRFPIEVTKSPAAMEIVLAALYQTGGEGTFIRRYWDGATRPWYSLEIASFGGEIHFYIWCRELTRNIVESRLYAQYSDIEVTEVEDYAKNFKFNPDTEFMWAVRYIKSKKDSYAPIRTYIDFGLHMDPKEELENNPIASVLEYMGDILPGENIFLQFVVRAHKKEKRGGPFSKAEDWRKAAEAEVDKIQAQIKKDMRITPTAIESAIIDGIERSLGKYPFDTEIRCIYISDPNQKDKFRFRTLNGLRTLLAPFSSNQLNGFKQDRSTDWDYPWQDFMDIRVNRRKRRYLEAYKRRMAFFVPYKENTMVLTNEELATMYHFPGSAVATPGLVRIPSKRAQAPANLPI